MGCTVRNREKCGRNMEFFKEKEELMSRIFRNVGKAIDRAEKLEDADDPAKVPGIMNTWEETRGNGMGTRDVSFTSTTRVGWGKG